MNPFVFPLKPLPFILSNEKAEIHRKIPAFSRMHYCTPA
ncbi:hypothetical protein B4096_3393 [Heyndrickxia coagulans]|uniref:Uncharacterized protein n=1 Tax=Heyndrickxia coagulans TaxID=1398 RepID=A0AAN0T564_HEYCO|nr:hypothetical protein SB48_HM08orf03652 [Heyndrickxia coagulans]KYC81361.1 hypothetical protein B4096_3393 [Heyndrickxia coagulans]